MPVKELMVIQPRCVGPETSVAEAAGIMAALKIGCLPVVDERHRLVGIVSVIDLLKHLARGEGE